MAGLSLFGLLFPRGFRAYSRAQIDEDGKKDLTELFKAENYGKILILENMIERLRKILPDLNS